ncbi:hypothetical protein [Natronorubrum sp. DTA7]|uniref:hypothetical protein n=1 Tax=Natronorubrum sp. DTA7 TaxID=3447016 RepID=UPI003F8341C0
MATTGTEPPVSEDRRRNDNDTDGIGDGGRHRRGYIDTDGIGDGNDIDMAGTNADE